MSSMADSIWDCPACCGDDDDCECQTKHAKTSSQAGEQRD